MCFQNINPVSELSRVDGHCRIGIQPNANKSLIMFDMAVNVTLTAIFICKLHCMLHSESRPLILITKL